PVGVGGGAPRGGPPPSGNFAARGGGNLQGGNWQHSRRHNRGPFITYGFGAPYYDYATPYPYYYGDDGCWAYRFVRGAYRRVWVCYCPSHECRAAAAGQARVGAARQAMPLRRSGPGRAPVDSCGPFCYTRGQTGARAMALWRIGGLRHIQARSS